MYLGSDGSISPRREASLVVDDEASRYPCLWFGGWPIQATLFGVDGVVDLTHGLPSDSELLGLLSPTIDHIVGQTQHFVYHTVEDVSTDGGLRGEQLSAAGNMAVAASQPEA